jgi:hypothetical protein
VWLRRTLAMPLNRWYHSDYGRQEFNEAGVDPFEEDWDDLLILDACRYDTFAKLQRLPGDLSVRESRASTTPEFLRATIHGRDLRDTVYVTATPQIHNHDDIDHSFHQIVDVWRDNWDSELKTVHPTDVAAATVRANERFPDKRLLVHFIQPHYPFIGETGREQFSYEGVGLDDPADSSEDAEKFWDTVGTAVNDVSEEVVWTAYEENLSAALPHVEHLLTGIEGKTVVTADHGEMIYDRATPIPVVVNGHPGGLYTRQLVEVPWHTHVQGDRRRVTTDPEATREREVDEDIVEQRLRDLGYA